ncbi:hypothetical protein DCW30_22030 [Streptomyces alfalfae]|uniref:Uncharacterized protein n=1 Tax=Streptomyces alfalfae TaxID=1642299 RepID=A0ABN4VIW7_9ACTN|nr:hypothetical protein [Streptomyces alfalfae]APY87576.1 hypothetical protein A7J05_19275 [Streptomyces alfalfae]AYA17991.1 hypothetical protein D3X13_18680 [Streptomyces fradiae]RXX40107.1 hypothetical protein DCW30_22030 [Streptomyces alfalfae]RZM96645.1 hypothetical protein D4104_14475 [Streptomyces alfalfae]
MPSTIAAMLDADEQWGQVARSLRPGEAIPLGALPVLVADTTVYGTLRVEQMLQAWDARLPKPWLVWTADAPMRPAPDARLRIRALQGRLAGVSPVPYLPVLRTVERPDQALEHRSVQAAAAKLRASLERKG